jgi:peptidyl-prolyl cis-trans isomerase C
MKKFLILPLAFLFIMGCSDARDNNVLFDGLTLATVGDTTITEDDYLRELSGLPEWARSRFASDANKDEFLDTIIEKEVLYAEALRNRLDKDEDFAKKLDEFKKMNLITILLEKEVRDKVVVSDAEVKALYDSDPEKYKRDAGVSASHILVETEEEGNSIIVKLKEGSDFAKLAADHSIDTSNAGNGGSLGFFSRGNMVPEFEDAAFSLEVGEVSGLVKTQFGYHIIKVTDKKEGTQLGFEQAAELIKRQLLAEKQRSAYKSFVDGLKDSAEITKNTNALSSVTMPW